MAGSRTLLFVRMDIPAEIEDDFNHWYDTEHVPWRLTRVPGFESGRRFRALEGVPKYAGVYGLASPEVLKSAPYLRLREEESATPLFQRVYHRFQNMARTVYEEITPGASEYQIPSEARILLVTMLVPRPEHEEEFNDWYNTEHLAAMLSVSGVLTARRFRALEGEPKYVALYDVANYDVLKGQEYLRKRESPWRDRMGKLLVTRIRNVYERIYPPVS